MGYFKPMSLKRGIASSSRVCYNKYLTKMLFKVPKTVAVNVDLWFLYFFIFLPTLACYLRPLPVRPSHRAF